MRVLIVGCGYVGRPLGAELVRQGHEVFGLRRTAAADPDLRAVGIVPLHADISQHETLAPIRPDFEWVVNCAAPEGGTEADYRRTYLAGTQNLIRWLAGSPLRQFVHLGSTAVYGQDDGSLVTEASPTEPASATGRVLVETEQALLSAVRRHGFPAVLLRVAGIYGPGRTYYLQSLRRGAVGAERERDRFVNQVHRDDVVGAILAALARGQPGAIYNVCDNEPVRRADLERWLATALRLPVPPVAGAGGGAPSRRGVTNKRVSNRRLRVELGYTFRFPTFREGYAAAMQQPA